MVAEREAVVALIEVTVDDNSEVVSKLEILVAVIDVTNNVDLAEVLRDDDIEDRDDDDSLNISTNGVAAAA